MDNQRDIMIRPVRMEDLEGLNATINGICREGRFLSSSDGFSLDAHRAFLSHIVRLGLPQVVAESDAGIVGWCDVLPANNPSANHTGQLGVGVAKAYRGRGIGRRLVGRGLQMAREHGMAAVELEVFSDNEVAIALYRSYGFMLQGAGTRGADRFGRPIVTMVLELRCASAAAVRAAS